LKKLFFKLFYVCLSLEKLVNKKYFPVNEKHFHVKEKFGFISRKVLFFYFGWKHFLEVVKNLEILYYLLIMSNLVLKFLIAIYFI
jgi:NhaP-type Na+/H+ or K+/H+ antiporter